MGNSLWAGDIIELNTLGPRQNGRHFPDNISKWIFLNENVWNSINISLKFVPWGAINNIPTMVQVMAWRDQATIHYLNQWWLDYRRIYASLGLNELINIGSVNGLLHESIKPFSESVSTNHHWGLVTFTCRQFHWDIYLWYFFENY